MKIKMWCLVNKKKNVPISIAIDEVFVVGFATKKDLRICTGPLLWLGEEVRKIEVEV